MKERIGIITIFLILFFLMPSYLLMISFPVLIVGAVIIAWKNQSKGTKLLWLIIPILLWYPFIIGKLYLYGQFGMMQAQKIEFRFPANYQGAAIIISNVPCGEDKILENGREILNIPKDGILMYSNELKSGFINHKYYIYNENGTLEELKELDKSMFWDGKNEDLEDEIGVWSKNGHKGTKYYGSSTMDYNVTRLVIAEKKEYEDKGVDMQIRDLEKEVDSLIYSCGYELYIKLDDQIPYH